MLLPWQHKLEVLAQELSEKLEDPLIEEEIRSTTEDMGADKAPGPDRFTREFLKKLWNIIKEDVLGVFQDFIESGTVNSCVNEMPNSQEIKGNKPLQNRGKSPC